MHKRGLHRVRGLARCLHLALIFQNLGKFDMRFRASVRAPKPLSAAVAIATIRFPKLRCYGGGTSTFLFCLSHSPQGGGWSFFINSSFGFRHSFVIPHSDLVIQFIYSVSNAIRRLLIFQFCGFRFNPSRSRVRASSNFPVVIYTLANTRYPFG